MQDINLSNYKGQIFRHFKGNLYLLIDLAQHSETHETMVIYKALYGLCTTYVRPKNMFLDEVDKVKYPNATQKYRFEYFQNESLKSALLKVTEDIFANMPE